MKKGRLSSGFVLFLFMACVQKNADYIESINFFEEKKMIVYPVALYHLFDTNAYFYIDEKTKHGFLIDPAAEADKLLEMIKKNGWTIEKILITHGHFDHIGAVDALHKALGIPYLIHKNGKEYLTNADYNLSLMTGEKITLNEAQYLNDGDVISLNAAPEVKLQVIHTPGHTTDSVIYLDKENKIAFVGDTIFKQGFGRTDFPGGNMNALRHSISDIVLKLDDETKLYSGHSEETTVAAEKAFY